MTSIGSESSSAKIDVKRYAAHIVDVIDSTEAASAGKTTEAPKHASRRTGK